MLELGVKRKVVGSLLSTNSSLISASIVDKLAMERGTVGLKDQRLRGPVQQRASLEIGCRLQASEGHLNNRKEGGELEV